MCLKFWFWHHTWPRMQKKVDLLRLAKQKRARIVYRSNGPNPKLENRTQPQLAKPHTTYTFVTFCHDADTDDVITSMHPLRHTLECFTERQLHSGTVLAATNTDTRTTKRRTASRRWLVDRTLHTSSFWLLHQSVFYRQRWRGRQWQRRSHSRTRSDVT